ncbi:MAG: hypothetical protein F7B17_05335 [Desulfurococcales archaeon]|nr:hypothetical protein [Desulfurococcales archaeon]
MYRRGSSKRGGRLEAEVELEGGLDLKLLFSRYYSLYSRKGVWAPPEMARREFAFQLFEREAYTRHISFSTPEELANYLASKAPRHAYYSIALYEVPDAPEMEGKGWLGSLLMFDIDVDSIEGCGEIASDDCMVKGAMEAEKLLMVLRRDFGVEGSVYFTGNRGFHVLVDCGWCLELGREERREIARYVALEGFEGSVFPQRSRRVVLSPRDPGPRWRIAEVLGLEGESVVGIEDVIAAAGEAGVRIDMQVTQDISRLARLLYTLNGKAGLLVTPLEEPSRFTPDPSLSPFKGEVEVVFEADLEETRILGWSVGGKRGEEATLPAEVGVMLAAKGVVRVVGGVVRVVV